VEVETKVNKEVTNEELKTN
jgi:hypothetical protein